MAKFFCRRCSANYFTSVRTRYGAHQCPECLAFLEPRAEYKTAIETVLFVAALAVAGLVVAFLVAGCSSPFVAADDASPLESSAGAGGYTQTMAQAGAGGEAGQSYTNRAGGASSVGGAPAAAGSAGVYVVVAGTGSSSAGSSSAGAAGSSSAAECLAEWSGSRCDTCSSSPPPSSGRSCMDVVRCYAELGCTPATCGGACDYSGPTLDSVVAVAHRVIACLCGGGS